MVLFRNQLRASEEDRRVYEQVKRELAGKPWKYMQDLRGREVSGHRRDPQSSSLKRMTIGARRNPSPRSPSS